MMRLSFLLAICLLSAGLPSSDQVKIDRSIGKEPVYKSKAPKYGLLVFGPEAKDRVWLVLDGDTLYVDRNGNGDLTDPGEKILAEKKTGRDPEEDGYIFEVGELTLGAQKHKGMTVYLTPLKQYADRSLGERADVKATLAKDPKAMAVSLSIDADVPGIKGGGVGGRVIFFAGPADLSGPLQLSGAPEKAPAVHLGPPFQVTFNSALPSLRAGRESELFLVVGSPGVGPGTFAMVGYENTIPNNAKLMAELILSPAKAGAPPIKEILEIKGRC